MFGLGGRDEDCSCLQDQCALDALRTALLACLDAQHSGYIFSGCLPLPPPLAQHSHTLTHAHTHFPFSPHGHVFSKQCGAHALGQQGSLRALSGTLAPAHSNFACHACFPSHTHFPAQASPHRTRTFPAHINPSHVMPGALHNPPGSKIIEKQSPAY